MTPITSNGFTKIPQPNNGNSCWIDEADFLDMGTYLHLAMDLQRQQPPVIGMVGMGLMIVARATNRVIDTIFEIDPEVITYCSSHWPHLIGHIVVGDYNDTLTGSFDALIFDIDPPMPPIEQLLAHVRPGGCLYNYTAPGQKFDTHKR